MKMKISGISSEIIIPTYVGGMSRSRYDELFLIARPSDKHHARNFVASLEILLRYVYSRNFMQRHAKTVSRKFRERSVT